MLTPPLVQAHTICPLQYDHLLKTYIFLSRNCCRCFTKDRLSRRRGRWAQPSMIFQHNSICRSAHERAKPRHSLEPPTPIVNCSTQSVNKTIRMQHSAPITVQVYLQFHIPVMKQTPNSYSFSRDLWLPCNKYLQCCRTCRLNTLIAFRVSSTSLQQCW